MSLGVRVTYLPVGQGTANMVEVYNYDLDAVTETLVQLYLIDCGGESSRFSYVASCKNILLHAMTLRASSIPDDSCTHYLDVLSISHQDKDHYCLFQEILEEVSADLKIGKYYRFDNTPCFTLCRQERYTSKSFDKFNSLVRSNFSDVTNCHCFASPPNFAMNAGNDYLPFFNYQEDESTVSLTALYSNGVAPDKAALGVRRNTLSLYIVLSMRSPYGKISEFHFPGDASVHTMNAINENLKEKKHQLYPNEMTAPHHGSIISARDGSNTLAKFYEKIQPERHIISAGPFSKHGHPHASYANVMFPLLGDSHICHSIYFNKTDKGSNLTSTDFTHIETNKKLYTLCRKTSGKTASICRENAEMVMFSSHHFEDASIFRTILYIDDNLPDFLSRHPRYRDTANSVPEERAVSKPDNSMPAE